MNKTVDYKSKYLYYKQKYLESKSSNDDQENYDEDLFKYLFGFFKYKIEKITNDNTEKLFLYFSNALVKFDDFLSAGTIKVVDEKNSIEWQVDFRDQYKYVKLFITQLEALISNNSSSKFKFKNNLDDAAKKKIFAYCQKLIEKYKKQKDFLERMLKDKFIQKSMRQERKKQEKIREDIFNKKIPKYGG